jgi:hypothetical protein
MLATLHTLSQICVLYCANLFPSTPWENSLVWKLSKSRDLSTNPSQKAACAAVFAHHRCDEVLAAACPQCMWMGGCVCLREREGSAEWKTHVWRPVALFFHSGMGALGKHLRSHVNAFSQRKKGFDHCCKLLEILVT